ncbi:MAG TPA: hypothetical protein VFL93_10775 [Longimicrobiaceae bacterium]|nr:hypothetical protein [Longimicrobiaceae bacterium]
MISAVPVAEPSVTAIRSLLAEAITATIRVSERCMRRIEAAREAHGIMSAPMLAAERTRDRALSRLKGRSRFLATQRLPALTEQGEIVAPVAFALEEAIEVAAARHLEAWGRPAGVPAPVVEIRMMWRTIHRRYDLRYACPLQVGDLCEAILAPLLEELNDASIPVSGAEAYLNRPDFGTSESDQPTRTDLGGGRWEVVLPWQNAPTGLRYQLRLQQADGLARVEGRRENRPWSEISTHSAVEIDSLARLLSAAASGTHA